MGLKMLAPHWNNLPIARAGAGKAGQTATPWGLSGEILLER